MMQLTKRKARRTIGLVAGAALIAVTLTPVLASQALSGADFYATVDLSRPELAAVKAAVDVGDYASADEELRDFYAGRQQPFYLQLEGDAGAIPRAEDVAAGIFEFDGGQVRDYYDDQAGRIDVDWDDDWGEYEDPPVNAPSLMNRFTFYPDLIKAYLALPAADPRRDEIAGAWMEIALDFIADKGDVPIGAAPHNRLTEGIRLRFWLDAFSVFKDSTAVTAADVVSYVDYMRQSASEIQSKIDTHKGNNWYVSLARSIYMSGIYLPEFKDAPTWRFKGMSAADRYVDRNMHSDGLSYEPAINYHNYVLNLLATIQEFGELNGDTPFTDEELSFLQLQAEAMTAVTMPDFTIPLFGDSRNAELDLSGLGIFADVFGRDDMKWVATDGAEGQQPAWGSILYPESYAVMRSGWNPDDQYMFIGNEDTNYNASHRHPDDLGVVAYAYGRPLVVDPGAFNLTASESANWLRDTTEAHNTVEVGGVPQPKTTQSVPSARRSLLWYSNDGFDFYQGDHEDYQPIIHNRSVFSPKPGFWVVSDVLAGSPGADDYRQLWHFPADAPVAIDSGTEAVNAGFGTVPGVVVAPVDPGTTTTNLHQDGYVADGFGNLHSNVDYVSFSQTTSGTATFDTLLYPGDDGAAPDVSVDRISLPVSTDVATAMELDLPDDATGVYYLSHEQSPATRSVGSFQYDGRLFYIEENAAGGITRLSLAAGTMLDDGNTTLLSSTSPVNDVSVEYNGSQLILSTGGSLDGDLTVHAPGVTDVVLNGTSVSFMQNGDAVTVAAPQIVTGDTLVDEPFGAIRDGGVREWSFDNEDAEHWQVQQGDWSVTPGAGEWVYRQTDSDVIGGQTAVAASLDDVAVTTDVTRGAAAPGIHALGVMLRYQDAGNHYRLELLQRASGDVFAQIIGRVDGESTVLASEAVTVDLDESHAITGTIRGDRIEFAVDGSALVSATDDRLTTGGIGLYAHRTEASFGDVRLDARTAWDFDDDTAEGWRGLQGTWVPDQGAYTQTNTGQNTGMAMVVYDVADVDVSATVSRGQTGSSAHGYGIALRMHDERSYYMARIYRTNAGVWAQLYKVIGGQRTDFANVPLTLDPAEPHHLRARASGDLLELWIDGELVATAVDGTERIPSGGVGLQAHNATVSFDDVAIEELTDHEAWSASRGSFVDRAEDLTMRSSGIERSRLDVAETVLWEDYVAEATIEPSDWTGAGEVGLAVRATKDTLGYRAVLVDTGSGRYARIERYVGGSRATADPVVIAQEQVNFSKTGPLPVEVTVRGSTIEFRLDGVLVASATDTVIGRGGVSIIGSDVNANVTNILVRELVEDDG
jgi:hypothetical protein